MIGLLIVDDNPQTREGLRMRLSVEPDMRVLGESCQGEDVAALVKSLRPAVVVLDVGMPNLAGLATARSVRSVAPHLPIVMLTLYADACQRAAAASVGAYALHEKDGNCARFVDTIRRAAAHAGEMAI